MALLDVDRISRYFTTAGSKDPYCVFSDLSMEVFDREFVAVLGHSGCGKSTLLNIIAGIDYASKGYVFLDGKEITGPGLDRMVVFQNFALMPWLTVWGNIKLAVKAAHPDWSRHQVNAWVERYVAMVGLTGSESKRPAELSGGMRQRVGLARAFCVEPRILLLDEPFAQIDALTRGVIQEELVRMWEETGTTIFMVTHDVDEAILLSDRIVLMSRGPSARIMDQIEVPIPRPRGRTTVIEHPSYYKIRNRIIRFLSEGSLEKEPAPSVVSLSTVRRV
ncbi:ABC transporter ATP-binding protein [Desulfomonile tiedjei]|uniref:Nitrate transport ATP-binding subunits C and D n=1 Tax=Desulfomonile tiedjei (strain ATCC 49306 / DSM 6799 / DCB-1) TaxID=706587 RepID=I4C051_DESTA|nr:ABC transporter ATP-binding protein [Desulfomonile tiedjei]AFM22942.1 nitrate transport ATP-binding subunits C and D [Desulfomonile tiedjei DSM 6799]